MSKENKKKVDKDQKEQVSDEDVKEFFKQPSFSTFISSLAMQVMILLGEEKDLEQSKYLIDVLNILKDKTKGNLSQE
ncbi:DUF1844 domain-containing protein, partial [bacterium]|nr:DUF1844 domain-containing protein [bacterium]